MRDDGTIILNIKLINISPWQWHHTDTVATTTENKVNKYIDFILFRW